MRNYAILVIVKAVCVFIVSKSLDMRNLSLSLVVKNRSSGFLTWSDTNKAAQPQKISRGLKFRIYEVERLYYPCSENKGADQLFSYCAADLHLCFRI